MARRELILRPPSLSERRRALKIFAEMLNEKPKEIEWQQFFDDNPFVLTETLPLKFDAIFSQVPLLAGTPDYLFYRKTSSGITGDFGVVELKRPDQSIVGTYSSKIITPSRHVRAAQQQVTQYLESVSAGRFINSEDFFIAGNRRHAFIIIGTASEVTLKCHDEVLRGQFKNLMPAGFHLYTYDEIFALFRASVVPNLQVLFASPYSTTIERVAGEFEAKRDLGARASAQVVHTAGLFHSKIDIYREGHTEKANAKEFIDVILLHIQRGEKFVVEAEGHDSAAALSAIDKLIDTGTGFGLTTSY